MSIKNIKIAGVLSLSLIFNPAISQTFTPKVENIKTNTFSISDLQNNGCPNPPLSININPIVSPPTFDYSKKSKELKMISNNPEQITGLHTVFLNINPQVQLFYLEDQQGRKTCYSMWPSTVTINLNTTIMVASEAAQLYCTRNATEDHEQEHQKVALYAFQESQKLLHQRLQSLYSKPVFFNSYNEALNHYNSNIEHIKSQFLRQFSLIADPLNAKLDSPQNYAIDQRKCPHEKSTLAYYLSLN
jgi:hypothetical protein